MTSETDIRMTNSCSCWDEDEENLSCECSGWCWTDQVDEFHDLTRHLFSDWQQKFWIAAPVWSGTVEGMFTADSGKQLINAITPANTEWRLEATIYDDRIEGLLYHHDVPTGGRIIVTPIKGKS